MSRISRWPVLRADGTIVQSETAGFDADSRRLLRDYWMASQRAT
jgi:hypothetical protein